MPLVRHEHFPDGSQVAIWQTVESASYFIEKLRLDATQEEYVSALSTKKKTEFLGTQLLLDYLSTAERPFVIEKDQFGKPHLVNHPLFISISHTLNYVAIILSPKLCGIDLQTEVSKIHRIEHKFVRHDELSMLDNPDKRLEFLHVLWGAKECLYKSYGKRQLNFKEHLRILNYSSQASGSCTGAVTKEDYHKEFKISWSRLGDLYLVVAKEIL